MTSTIRDPDQLEAALDEVFAVLCVAAENPGKISVSELGQWLRKTAAEREQKGDVVAAQMLDALAVQAEDNE
ncbi:hypothetical protein [Paracoccus chinensis]|uniref:Uncharacterized protein n=1 Tax=Paracoccus chinensis TaxID=525640 RepID=A0A1G9JGZ7_9RHOB|nr:hypothetical protein [Paracoccus chinensis]SDL36562.1 hypothetical protein SAMN04487971_109124 [Paracoccus chinensis]